MNQIYDFIIKDKRVFIRADLNVPMQSGIISSENRIKASLPTIRYALKAGSNGSVGEHKTIIVTATPSGTITVTPSTALGYTSISFAAVGDTAQLMYTSNGWSILSIFRANVT